MQTEGKIIYINHKQERTRQEPCGDPQLTSAVVHDIPLILENCILYVKQDLNQSCSRFFIPHF